MAEDDAEGPYTLRGEDENAPGRVFWADEAADRVEERLDCRPIFGPLVCLVGSALVFLGLQVFLPLAVERIKGAGVDHIRLVIGLSIRTDNLDCLVIRSSLIEIQPGLVRHRDVFDVLVVKLSLTGRIRRQSRWRHEGDVLSHG